MRQAVRVMRRYHERLALVGALVCVPLSALLIAGCPARPDEAPDVGAPGSPDGAAEDAVESETLDRIDVAISAMTDSTEAPVHDTTDTRVVATSDVSVSAASAAEATSLTLATTPRDTLLSVRGFPAVSADGMHLALIVGDRASGPLVLQVTRLDGSVLLEKTLIEAGETRAEDEEWQARLARRVGGRVTAAQRVLAQTGMRSLTRLPTQAEGGTALIEAGGQLAVALPGFTGASHARALLDRPCATASRVQALYADLEHGLVVAQLMLTPRADCAPPATRAATAVAGDWQIFALTPSP